MTKEQLFEAMVGIDEKQLEHSERVRRKSFLWVSWGAAAACIGLLGAMTVNQYSSLFMRDIMQDRKSLVAGVLEESRLEETSDFEICSSLSEQEMLSIESAEIKENTEDIKTLGISEIGKGSFRINGVQYIPIAYEEYQDYGLVLISQEELSRKKNSSSNSADKAFSETISLILEEDLGEQIGVIEECEEEVLAGCAVYQYASFSKEEICIVQIGDSYQFYKRDTSFIEEEE